MINNHYSRLLTLPAALSLCLIPSIAYAHGYEGLFGLVMGFSVDVLAIHAVLSIIACRKLPNRSPPIFILSIILITISFIIIAYTLNIFFGTGGIIIAIIILLAFFISRINQTKYSSHRNQLCGTKQSVSCRVYSNTSIVSILYSY